MLEYYDNYYMISNNGKKIKIMLMNNIDYNGLLGLGAKKPDNVIIKNKQGNIMIWNGNWNSNDGDGKEIYVQLLLGKRLNFKEYMKMFKYFYESESEYDTKFFIKLIRCFEYNYGIDICNKEIIKLYEENESYEELTKYVKNMNIIKFIKLITENELDINEDTQKIINKIREGIYVQDKKIGGNKKIDNMIKYIKIKSMYLKIKLF